MIQDRDSSRRFFIDVWNKHQSHQPLQAMEEIVLDIILQHPEYHRDLENPEILQSDYSPEQGKTNPFLHMGLHVALHEQINADRPSGIRGIYEQLLSRYGSDTHNIEHRMIDCLAEILWLAQSNNTLPDEIAYLERLRKL